MFGNGTGCLQRTGSSLRNQCGGNTKRIGMPGKRRERRGMARKAMEWQGLFTAVSIYWVLIGGNTNWLVPARHGKPRRGKARAVISGVNVQRAFTSVATPVGVAVTRRAAVRLGLQSRGEGCNAAGWVFTEDSFRCKCASNNQRKPNENHFCSTDRQVPPAHALGPFRKPA